MPHSAHATGKKQVLITQVSSFLGASLAKSYLAQNCAVWGLSTAKVAPDLITNPDFILGDIDLSQPPPHYLPQFDVIFALEPYTRSHQGLSHVPEISPAVRNIVSLGENLPTKVFVIAPITAGPDFYDYLVRGDPDLKKSLKLFLVGDLYGPGMSLDTTGLLANLIGQAVKTDKIILENEGLAPVYPAYITDVIFAANKIVFGESPKSVYFLASEPAKTALTCAYEIQNAASLACGKQLGLFFAGPPGVTTPEPQILVRTGDLGFIPKVELAAGLKNTFDYFVSKGLIEFSQVKPVSTQPQRFSPRPQPPVQMPASPAGGSVARTDRFPKVPRVNLNLRSKNLLLGVVAIIILATAKTGLDIVLATRSLKKAQENLLAGNFSAAAKAAENARKSATAAANKTQFFPYRSLHIALEGVTLGAGSLNYFILGAQDMSKNLANLTSPESKNGRYDLETPSANFKKAASLASQAATLLSQVHKAPFQKSITKAHDSFLTLSHAASSAFELTTLTNDLTGAGSKKTYLVLLQNNTELRPGGGFIGNFAQVEFDEGKLQNITVEDIYTIDGQLQEKIEPPKELSQKLGLGRLYLRDSNWSGDFAINAKTARDLFKKETGRDVDGVVATDLTLVQSILTKIGPIKLSDYNEEIGADNLFERGEYHSEVGFFPGSTQKRDFFAALSRTLINRLLSEKNTANIPALIETIRQGLREKHLMATFDNPTLSTYVATHGWDQPLPQRTANPADDTGQTRDFLGLVEANLGANKVNRFLERKISYEMTVGRDADLLAKLTIAYTNNSAAETWPGGKYVNFLRVYAPFAAGLEDFKLSIPPQVPAEPKPVKQPSAREDNVIDKNDVEVTLQGNLTVFVTFVEVPVSSTQVVTFTYRIPKNIKLETAPTYHLYIQKQAGTGADPLEFKFNLPSYLLVKSVNGDQKYQGQQNLSITTDLATDRQFEIEVAKK